MKWLSKQVLSLLVVLTIILVCMYSHLGSVHRFIPGFWVGGESYLQESGLTDMCIYITPRSVGPWAKFSGRCTFDAFILMATADGLICNQSAEVRFSCTPRLTTKQDYEGSCRFYFSEPDETPLPETMRFNINPAVGTLSLHDDEVLRGYLHKDAVATEAAIMADKTI